MADNFLCLGELSVDDIEEISWDSGAFSSLELPENRKEIVRSLVERHTRSASEANEREFDDIIRGKGQSLIILLQYDSLFHHFPPQLTPPSSGPPGVGKTLTVEAIAEEEKVPIYNVCQSLHYSHALS